MELKEVLKELCLTPAPAGYERDLHEVCRRLMSGFGTCSVDNRGNFFCTVEGENKHFLLDAHTDQISYAVTSIEEGGFLKIAKVGGMDRRISPSQEVIVLAKEPLYGIIGCKPPHLTEESERKKAPKIEDLFVDTGLGTEALKEAVDIGDRVVFKPYFANLKEDVVTATAIDDRAGMAIIVRVLELLRQKGSHAKITAVFSSLEEVGGAGAGNASYRVEADEAFAIDVSFAAQPEVEEAKKQHTMKLGGGAFIGFSPLLDREMSRELVRIAKEQNIPHAAEVMGGRTGTNADEIAAAKCGTRTACISPPIRNMHTPVEVADLRDLESCACLIAAYILEKEGK